MQTLDIQRPEMPDLQFTLLVTALCTSHLTVLNIPNSLRRTIFDRCWVLIHESPPPGNPEEQVLDLRPWNEVTLDAMAETIRSVLTDAGIRTLTWDHPASNPTQTSTAAAQPLLDRLEQLYPQASRADHAQADHAHNGEALVEGPDHLDRYRTDVRHLADEMASVMAALVLALTHRAENLTSRGKDRDLVAKLLKGATVIRDSGYLYLAWAHHYAAFADEPGESAEEIDEHGIAAG